MLLLETPKRGAPMMDYAGFAKLSPTTFADGLTRDRVVDIGIRPLWTPMPRVASPAYPVRCPPATT
jgi:4-hydroxy-4-methyl-2-oxoglutarate aldolase